MEYRRLGNSGMKVSAISLGAWLTYGSKHVADDAADKCIRKAIELGVNFIDVADIYAYGEAEKTVGRVIKDYTRSDLVISTKAYWNMSENVNDRGLSRKHIFESVERSLKRFDMDYLDIFFCHRYDDETPTEETVRAISDLIQQGKILYWGTSMWSAAAIEEAVGIADRVIGYRPVTEQPIYNMLDRDQVEGEVQMVCEKQGVGLVVWSPLAQGLLTGKYNDGVPSGSRADQIEWVRKGVTEERIAKVRELSKLAAEMGTSMAALALAWAMKNPVVDSVITGASRPEQVEENMKALDVTISDEIDARIEEILDNKPTVNRHN
ncbi:MAG: aldo/keto reductase family protein [Phototrophicaceae bacterium]